MTIWDFSKGHTDKSMEGTDRNERDRYEMDLHYRRASCCFNCGNSHVFKCDKDSFVVFCKVLDPIRSITEVCHTNICDLYLFSMDIGEFK